MLHGGADNHIANEKCRGQRHGVKNTEHIHAYLLATHRGVRSNQYTMKTGAWRSLHCG